MIYVFSDIHGRADLYFKMLEQINLSDEDTLITLGDVIDRGSNATDILLDMMNRKNVIYIIGNHELMMYSHFTGDIHNDFWFNSSNGGDITFQELNSLPYEKREDIKNYIFDQTYLQYRIDDYLLSHSYFYTQDTIKYWKLLYKRHEWNVPMEVTWNSPWRRYEYVPEQKYDDGLIHVIGHVPVQKVTGVDYLEEYRTKNIINIDGGCAYSLNSSGLICLNLTTDEGIYIQ